MTTTASIRQKTLTLATLSTFIQNHGGQIGISELSSFYMKHPSAQVTLYPLQATIKAYGDLMGLCWECDQDSGVETIRRTKKINEGGVEQQLLRQMAQLSLDDQDSENQIISDLKKLRTFVLQRGGRIDAGEIGTFFEYYERAKDTIRPLRKVIDKYQGVVQLSWQNNQVFSTSSKKKDKTIRDHLIGLLEYVQQNGNSITGMQFGEYLKLVPEARGIAPLKKVIPRYGQEFCLMWEGSENTLYYKPQAVPEPRVPRNNTGADARVIADLLKLRRFVAENGGSITTGEIGKFLQQFPDTRTRLTPFRATICRHGSEVALEWSENTIRCQAAGPRNCDHYISVATPSEVSGAGSTQAPVAEDFLPDEGIHYISTVSDARKLIAAMRNDASCVGVDMEGDLRPDGRVSLLQLSCRKHRVMLFDLLQCPEIMSTGGLGEILNDPTVIKIFHDGRHDLAALQGQFQVTVQNVFDTQAAYSVLKDFDKRVGLNVMLQEYAHTINRFKTQVRHYPGVWDSRPLPQIMTDYAAEDVRYLLTAFDSMTKEARAKACLHKCWQKSREAVYAANTNGAQKSDSVKLSKAFLKHIEDVGLKKPGTTMRVSELVVTYYAWKEPMVSVYADEIIAVLENAKVLNHHLNTIQWLTHENQNNLSNYICSKRKELETDKRGVLVDQIAFTGLIPAHQKWTKQLTIANSSDAEVKVLSAAFLAANMPVQYEGFTLENADIVSGSVIPPESTSTIHVSFQHHRGGYYRVVLAITLEKENEVFHIGRFLEARVGDSQIHKLLRPAEPFVVPGKKRSAGAKAGRQ